MPPPPDDSGLRTYLADRDVPCPGCGYNLRGLPSAICPECRQEVRISIALAETRIGALVLILAPLFAAAGASGALLLIVLILMFRQPSPMPSGPEATLLLWIPLTCFLTCGGAAVLMCTRRVRAWFRTRTRLVRILITLASSAIAAAWFITFTNKLLQM